MNTSIEWIITTVMALITLIGGIIVRDRQISSLIAEGDGKLHDRVSQMQQDYVRRADLNDHIDAIQRSVYEMREEQRNTNKRIDALLTAMTHMSTNQHKGSL